MKILFLSHYFYPHIGGVEKHVYFVAKELVKRGYEVTVVTEQFDKKLDFKEKYDGTNLVRFEYPNKKFIGLFFVWLFLWRKRDLLLESDVIHIHDVFIWYLPFRFLFFWKKIYVTIHGYEKEWPFSFKSILQKRIAIYICNGSIGVGKYLEKYLKVKFSYIVYGAVESFDFFKKNPNVGVFVGRLSEDTGILKLFEWLGKHKDLKVKFIGDGKFKEDAQKYGKVYGFSDEPVRYFKNANYFFPGGYLSCIQAFLNKSKVKVFYLNKFREDIWKMSPMWKYIKNEDVEGAYEWAKKQTWEKLANQYLKLWGVK